MSKDLLTLSSANAFQLNASGKKSDWDIRRNITNESLIKLSSSISDNEIFKILNFARKFELEAFNIGIKFQKDKQNVYLMAQIADKDSLIADLLAENERLATILENHLPSEA